MNLSTIINILLYSNLVIGSFNFSNFTIKSYNITSYSLLTNLTNYNNLYSLYLLSFRPLKTDSTAIRGDGYKPKSSQSQRRDVTQRTIRPSGGNKYCGRW